MKQPGHCSNTAPVLGMDLANDSDTPNTHSVHAYEAEGERRINFRVTADDCSEREIEHVELSMLLP